MQVTDSRESVLRWIERDPFKYPFAVFEQSFPQGQLGGDSLRLRMLREMQCPHAEGCTGVENDGLTLFDCMASGLKILCKDAP